MVILRIIFVCDTCERTFANRVKIREDFQNIGEAVKNFEYNEGLIPDGWCIVHNRVDIDGKEHEGLMCPTCQKAISKV